MRWRLHYYFPLGYGEYYNYYYFNDFSLFKITSACVKGGVFCCVHGTYSIYLRLFVRGANTIRLYTYILSGIIMNCNPTDRVCFGVYLCISPRKRFCPLVIDFFTEIGVARAPLSAQSNLINPGLPDRFATVLERRPSVQFPSLFRKQSIRSNALGSLVYAGVAYEADTKLTHGPVVYIRV